MAAQPDMEKGGGYPPQQAPQVGYAPPPGQAAPPPGYTPQPAAVPMQAPGAVQMARLSDVPMQVQCPNCGTVGMSRTTPVNGLITWVAALGLCFVGIICAVIPFFVDGLKDVQHQCQHCSAAVGTYKRIGS